MNLIVPNGAVRCVALAQKTTQVIDVTRVIADLRKFGNAPLVISAFGQLPEIVAPHTVKMTEHLEPGANHVQNRAKARQLRNEIDSGKMLNVVYGHGKIVNKLYGKLIAATLKSKKTVKATNRKGGIKTDEIGLVFYDKEDRMIGIEKTKIAA